MRHERHILIAFLALAACTQPSPSANSAETPRNVATPTAAPPPVNGANAADAGNAAAPANPANAASANGLWGVAEEEDEASHRGIDFIAFNRTGRTITALSIRPDEGPLAPGAAEDPWSANILSQPELPDGQRAAAHYESDIELCRWQVRATFSDRQTRDYPGVNLCETIRVDLR